MGRREDARARFDHCLQVSDQALIGLLAAEADLIGDFTVSPRLVVSRLVARRAEEPPEVLEDHRSAS